MPTASGRFSGRSWLTYVLLVVVCVVWGFLFYQVASGLNASEMASGDRDLIQAPKTADVPIRADQRGSYEETFKSPFVPSSALFEALEPEPEIESALAMQAPPPVEVPVMRLIGVVDSTALVRDGRGKVHFLSLGDTLAGARLERIEEGQIRVYTKDSVFVFHVSG